MAASALFLAIGVVVILAVPRIQGDEGTWLAGLPLRLGQLAVPLLRGCRSVASPPAADRPDREPGTDVDPGYRTRGDGLCVRGRGDRFRGGRRRRGLRAVADRDGSRRDGVPATATPGGADGRPIGGRRGGSAVRGTSRFRPTARRQAKPVGCAAGTQVPRWFGSTGDGPSEVLSIFGRPGERMLARAAGGGEQDPHPGPHQ